MNTRLAFILFGVVLLSACASSSTERAAPETPEAVTLPEARRAEDAPVDQADLDVFCAMMTEALADRSVRLRVRVRQGEQRLATEQPERRDRLNAFLDNAPHAQGDASAEYAGVQAAAAQHGLTFDCPSFERVTTLRNADDPDMDEPAGLRAEMDALCAIVGTRVSSDPAAATQMAERIDAAITNQDLRQAWQALQNVHPSDRHSLLQGFSHEHGVSGWQCPALDAAATP